MHINIIRVSLSTAASFGGILLFNLRYLRGDIIIFDIFNVNNKRIPCNSVASTQSSSSSSELSSLLSCASYLLRQSNHTSFFFFTFDFFGLPSPLFLLMSTLIEYPSVCIAQLKSQGLGTVSVGTLLSPKIL